MSKENYLPGKIYETKDYGLFKLSNNRPVDVKRVEKLKKDIQTSDFGRSFPIIINKNGCVRDGQHRLTARMELGLPIFFHISEQNLNLNAVAKTNSMQKAWNTDDHIISRAKGGNKTFKAIENFASTNGLKPSQAISFFREGKSSSLRKGILSGDIVEISQQQINEAQKILNVWKGFRTYIPKMDYRSAVSACRKLVKTKGYKHEHMISQIDKNRRGFVPCANSETYLEMFEDFYNYRIHKQNRLKFTGNPA